MDDTYLNPGDKQIALYVIKAFVEFCDKPKIKQEFDNIENMGVEIALSMGKSLLKEHHILTEDEYKER